MDHTCIYCRNARRLNTEQIDRFIKSGQNPEQFLNDEYEDEMSSHMLMLNKRCALKKLAESRFTI